MKAIKKWLMDKEGVFIVITWWIILFVVFSILLGVNINNVVKNTKITEETSTKYIQEFISSGDLVLPYNENIASASARYDQENEHYYLQLKYNNVLEKDYESEVDLTGDATAKGKVSLKVEVIEVYDVSYNYTKNEIFLDLVEIKTEAVKDLAITIKATPSGELHILWNGEDTGVVYEAGSEVAISRNDENLVLNGVETDVLFYSENTVVSFTEAKDEEAGKTNSASLVVAYKLGSNSFTKVTTNDERLNETEKAIFNESVSYFTSLLEESIGISTSAFTLTIISAVVDALLIAFAVVGIVYLRKSKED